MEQIINILNLEKPIKIVFSKKPHASWDACYTPRFTKWGEVKSHHIKIYNNPERERDIATLIAHELIHAWQEENQVDDVHGKPFQKMAKKIRREFPGFRDIYRKDLDC